MPDDLPPDELTLEKAKELLANPAGEETPLGTHPETGLEVVAKNGRYGPFVTELLPEDAPKKAKPRTGSLFKDMSLDTITLEQAVKLLSLPRVVGVDAEGVEITAQNGRYGPYLKKGTDSRSLETEQQLFDITLERGAGDLRPAQAARPRRRGAAAQGARQRPGLRRSRWWSRRAASASTSPTASTTPPCARTTPSRQLTLERAAELLAERRAKGPAKKAAKKGAKKATAKKATAKKTTAKKTTAKKATAKKAAAKKS